MRQFVFGLLVAALIWWGYGSFAAKPAEAGPVGGPVAGGTGAQTPAEVKGSAPADGGAKVPIETLLPRTTVPPEAALNMTRSTGEGINVAAVLDGIAKADAASINHGWMALGTTSLAGADRARLLAALTPSDGDFAQLLAQLGNYNTFLQSAEGRAQANKALALAMAMPDADAVTAGTQLIGLCLRGHITREDTVARAFVDEAYRQYRVRVDRWLCDPANVQSARSYTVVGGDSLARIAAKFRRDKILVEDGTLAILNRIHNPNALQVGQKVKIPIEPITTVVEKRSFSLCVYVGDRLLRMYWVGHGENDKTPVAEFTIAEKQPKPQWTSPDGNVYPYGHPKNILGEFFIKLQHESYTGFGVHGTPLTDSICTMSSMGCVRMLAPDIEELFRLLPRGTKLFVRASAPTP